MEGNKFEDKRKRESSYRPLSKSLGEGEKLWWIFNHIELMQYEIYKNTYIYIYIVDQLYISDGSVKTAIFQVAFVLSQSNIRSNYVWNL